MNLAAAAQSDQTYGSGLLDGMAGGQGIWTTNNREVVAILMDTETYVNGVPTIVNANHAKNPSESGFSTPSRFQVWTTPGWGRTGPIAILGHTVHHFDGSQLR